MVTGKRCLVSGLPLSNAPQDKMKPRSELSFEVVVETPAEVYVTYCR